MKKSQGVNSMEFDGTAQKLLKGVGFLLFMLAVAYLLEFLLNLNNPYFNDPDAVELILNSAMYFLIVGGVLILFAILYPEINSSSVKALGGTVLLGLAALPGYGIGIKYLTRKCCSSCSTFEMHWLVNVIGLFVFIFAIGGIILVWFQYLKEKSKRYLKTF